MPPKFYKKKTFKGGAGAGDSTCMIDIGSAKFLVIVESPSKCSKIEHYLGPDYKCIASRGHFCEIVGIKSIDTKHNFHPTFTIIPEKAAHVKSMREAIAQFPKSAIILATDDDREGEGIAWHICQTFDLPLDTTIRIIFREITKPAILAAILSPTVLNQNLVHAQHARQILDLIVGFKISPLLWKHFCGGKTNALSAGRCQTPALRLVYDNAMKIRASEIETRYKTVGHFFPSQNMGLGLPFELNHEFETADEMTDFLERSKSKAHKHRFTVEKSRPLTKSPPKPFNTSRLLQVASNSLRSSPKQTMQICQSLYQNGHITYMRTENTKYSSPFLDTVQEFIKTRFGETKYVGDIANLENKDASNPHEAIRVTNLALSELPGDDSREATMYRLIWRNTVESCMADARYTAIPATISAPSAKPHSLAYTYTLEIPVFLGWKIVTADESKTKPAATSPLFFQTLSATEDVPFISIESKVVMRNHHSHYTEASLIQALEDLGIGRPSTFASLVNTIQERGYVKCCDIAGKLQQCTEFTLRSDNILDTSTLEKSFGQEKNKLVIQPLGILCVEFLVQYFENLFSYDYTRTMEERLDAISRFTDVNTANPWYEICRDCYAEIKELSKPVANMEKQSYRLDAEHELSFQQFGPSIKHTSPEDGKVTYKPVKKGIDVDIETLRLGKYTVADLSAFDNEYLGEYEGNPLKLKTGKFGPYLQWGDRRQSIRDIGIDLDNVGFENAVKFLDNLGVCGGTAETSDKPRALPLAKGVLRWLNTDMNIRAGNFGPYAYYKTQEMKSPKFFPIKKFPGKYDTCEIDVLVKWIAKTYSL